MVGNEKSNKPMRGGAVPGKILLLIFLAAYEFFSPLKLFFFGPRARCRFSPTCSAYARGCLQRHGIVKALRLILRRLLRCHPLAAGGFDPIP
jgi:putative membrane protein insertion efficiency factor